MSTPSRVYDPKILAQISAFYTDLTGLLERHFPEMEDSDVYIYSMEIVLQHRDEWTLGRIGLDDFPYFEVTDDDYGKTKVVVT